MSTDSCGFSINRHFPPHPPTMENGPRGGKTGRAGGRSIAFFFHRYRRVSAKPGEIVVAHRLGHVAVRTPHPRVDAENPRVGSIFPRVGLFFPRVDFCDFAAAGLSLSLFSLVKEREREEETGESSIPGFLTCLKKHPRICYKKYSYSVDEKGIPGTSSLYESTTCGFFGQIPRSTDKNAYTPHGGGSQ